MGIFDVNILLFVTNHTDTDSIEACVSIVIYDVQFSKSLIMLVVSFRRHGQRNRNAPTSSHVRSRGLGDAEVQWQPCGQTRTPWHGSGWSSGRTDDQPLQQCTWKHQIDATAATHGYGYVSVLREPACNECLRHLVYLNTKNFMQIDWLVIGLIW